jgi:hypothetical protein
VLAQEILAQQLLVETEDHRRLLIPATDVLTVLNRPAAATTETSDDGTGVPSG